ncbi:hypothetical protein MYX82_10395 [Acidobacteria bacterium AH-259-D05]|nr:hypothetical protein [Acidobacteria bacterium AH-259-D05]
MKALTISLLLVLLAGTIALAEGQGEIVVRAFAHRNEGGCERAYRKAFGELLQKHGTTFITVVGTEDSHIQREGKKFEERTQWRQETEVLLAGLFQTRTVQQHTNDGYCMVEIHLTQEELQKAEQGSVEIIQAQLKRQGEHRVSQDILSLRKEVKRIQGELKRISQREATRSPIVRQRPYQRRSGPYYSRARQPTYYVATPDHVTYYRTPYYRQTPYRVRNHYRVHLSTKEILVRQGIALLESMAYGYRW